MTLEGFLAELRQSRLVASVQADEGTPLDAPDVLLRLAQASLREGVRVLRLQGVENIKAVRAATSAPVIGLIKRVHPGFGPYITPTLESVEALLATGCEVVALDGTARPRPDGSTLNDSLSLIHAAGRLALADCDTVASVMYAADSGADLAGTTLAGYTAESLRTEGPDLEFLRESRVHAHIPVLAEGRYTQRWQIDAALRIGADGVVVGGALNDPIKQTRALLPSPFSDGRIGAVDLGGTWLRFAVFDGGWKMLASERTRTPAKHRERSAWVRSLADRHDVDALGVSSGGTIDPESNTVVETKPLIGDHLLQTLSDFAPEIPVLALNDGLATAWGHACLPEHAGRKVATLALGTGVGFGFVAEQRLWSGRNGEYPRLNDLPFRDGIIEDALGGLAVEGKPPAQALEAAVAAVSAVRSLYFPDDIVICGGLGLSAPFEDVSSRLHLRRSPFGEDAGLYGAAALALFPGWR